MSCPPSWRVAKTGGHDRGGHETWRHGPKRKPRLSARGVPRPRRNASAQAKHAGAAPKAVDETPDDKAQMSFTDPELHIMQTNNKGWDYCGNAQVSVDGACQIIVGVSHRCGQRQAASCAHGADEGPIWRRPVLRSRKTPRAWSRGLSAPMTAVIQ